jgi:hypothetical protein
MSVGRDRLYRISLILSFVGLAIFLPSALLGRVSIAVFGFLLLIGGACLNFVRFWLVRDEVIEYWMSLRDKTR